MTVPKFMLILHNRPGYLQELTPEDRQRKIEKYRGWVQALHASGRHVSGEKLGEEGGKRLRLQNGRLNVVDGPFTEAKEVVGGYVLFRAADYQEAIALTRECPFLEDGTVEIRQTDPMGCGGE